MRDKLFFIFFTIGLLAFVAYSANKAYGFPTGVTGVSGIQGGTCNGCHFGGISPDVTLSGPTMLLPGATGIYTLTIEGGQTEIVGSDAAGGFNVAVTSGVLSTLENAMDVQLLEGEITHTEPKSVNDMDEVIFSFQLTAPMTPTLQLTMYGAGNSVNGDGGNSGDAADADQLMITVQEPAAQIFLPVITGAD